MGRELNLETLGKLMIEHGLVIRAIPLETVSTYEAYHKDKIPGGVVRYMEEYKREMLQVTKKNSQGGKFVITRMADQGTILNNWGKPVVFYDTIEQAVTAFLNKVEK